MQRIAILAGAGWLGASAILFFAVQAGGDGARAQQAVTAPLTAQACIGCHGQDGKGQGSVPRIAGFNKELFAANWAAFRANQRPATIMNRVSRGYTDAEVAALADYFSGLK